ncbi:hypothetical protein PRZ48_014835 [Zasmidium cellare]|uniref:Arabinanase/levansucrase/invertase n=1 Tax=Zasmidium cellare TaxID=395010 RepID=A0ABR0DWU2_ZASCE|nr:hypothetical protein PRZ48_014835 [Zasmidium cellare]
MRFYTFFSASLLGLAYAATYSNPLREVNGGDPNITYHEGYYYFMSTTWSDLQMTRATTLEGLKNGETRQVWVDSTPSRCCNVWAPEMHYIDGAWHIYYSAGPNPLGDQRSHVIVGGSSPWDTYTYLGAIVSDRWAIDGTILRFPEQNYFVYSGFQDNGKQSLYIAPMTSAATIGESALLSSPDAEWESQGDFPVNEGPHALYHGGQTFLTFSGSYCWTASYALGLLTWNGGDPMLAASWTKTGPVFSSANGNYGTGHNSFFISPDESEIWNVYHSTPNSGGDCGSNRYSNAKVVQWNEDGSPNFGQAPAFGTVVPGPSGE